jgi:beta-N-acetylglucosaminidase
MNFTQPEKVKLAKDIDRHIQKCKLRFQQVLAAADYAPGEISKVHQDMAVLMQHHAILAQSQNQVAVPGIVMPPKRSLLP